MIKTEGLNKTFDGFQVINNLNIHVNKGSIYGLIGPNGAGKTTIIKHITGVLIPDSGSITIDGVPVYDNPLIKQRIGYIPDDLSFFSSYNLQEMSRFFKDIYPAWNQTRFEQMVSRFGLNSKRRLCQFSKGMQKQAAFILVMSAMPDCLILDEPIDGLDPIVRKVVWQYVLDDTAVREMTVLVSSHNLREIEGICDSVGILSKGSMLIERDLDDLKSDIHKIQVAYKDQPDDPYRDLTILHQERRGSVDLLIVRENRQDAEEKILRSSPAVFDILPLTLEEIFIYELGGSDYEDILF